MSFSFSSFDAREIEPSVGISSKPIPAGNYRAQIVKADWKQNKAGTGRFLELVFEVVRGDHQGSRIWARLNLENPSAQATQIAQGELSAVCHATGVLKPRNEQQLLNLPMVIEVSVEERKDKAGEYSNRITGYHSLESMAKQTKPQAVAAAASDDDSAPWE